MFGKFWEWLTGSTEIDRRPRSTKNGEALTDAEMKIAVKNRCPDCGSVLVEGPHGGDSINMYCSNESGCGSRFNFMGVFGVDRITDAQPKAYAH